MINKQELLNQFEAVNKVLVDNSCSNCFLESYCRYNANKCLCSYLEECVEELKEEIAN